MSVAGPIGKADPSTPEAREKDFQAFRETLDLIDLVRGCVLCPPGLDFINVCSCDECAPKIKMLRNFEIEIQSKQKLVKGYFLEVQAKEDLCMSFCQAALWTKRMYKLLHKNLKAVSENTEVPKKITKLGDEHQNMIKLMIEWGLYDETEAIPQDDDDSFQRNVLNEIDSGFFYYGKTKAKEDVLDLLRKLEKLEKDYVLEKKTAEAEGKVLDPSISRRCILSQIELVESFPVEKLRPEAEKLIYEICPRNIHRKMFHKARAFISKTCAAMISKRKAFWRRVNPTGTTGSNEHSLNGLSETLDFLIDKENSFVKQWEKEYAPYYTPHDLRGCDLCPPGKGFFNVCSCCVCAPKIEKLRDFEIEIKSKQKLVTRYFVEEQAKEDLCLNLCQAVKWTNRMYELLHKNLKAVSECSEVPNRSAKLGDVCKNMTEMMIEYGFFGKTDVVPQDDEDDDSFPYNGLNEIDSGLYYYGKTKAKDEVMTLLRDLENFEKNHVSDQETAEAEEKPLDLRISKGYIKSQIKLVERLPVEELQSKAKELLDEVYPRDIHTEMFHKARELISKTCAAMIKIRRSFWRVFCPSETTEIDEMESDVDNLNDLDKTLDKLIAKANSFTIEWEKEYAPYYTPNDRSESKRQRFEK